MMFLVLLIFCVCVLVANVIGIEGVVSFVITRVVFLFFFSVCIL